jgi:sugar transferase (PEP-CTERM/EpsH1 system associated)
MRPAMGIADAGPVAAPATSEPDTRAPLVVHVVETLAAAQAEHGLLNLISHLPPERYRHAIVCLRDRGGYQGDLRAHGVDIVHLDGRARSPRLPYYVRLFGVLRALRPDLIHTRDGTGLPAQVVAALAGVRARVHGEHGRGAVNPGTSLLRRVLCPLIDHFVAASADLEHWLVDAVGAPPARVSQIANGVDSVQFHPRLGPAAAVGPPGFMQDGAFVIGSVGPMDEAGNHTMLVDAFLRLIASPHPAHARLRLLIVGDGPARSECQALLQRAGAGTRVWLPGARADVPQLLRAMDLYVQPALAADRSHAILQAMATGLPVVAAAVGANTELVHAGFTGILVPPLGTALLASAIADYCRIPDMALRHGARARSQVIARHSLPAMARDYLAIYDALTRGTTDGAARVD